MNICVIAKINTQSPHASKICPIDIGVKKNYHGEFELVAVGGICSITTVSVQGTVLPYRSRGPLIFPRIAVGNEGVCPRRRPRRYGTVYLYRALTWSSVVL